MAYRGSFQAHREPSVGELLARSVSTAVPQLAAGFAKGYGERQEAIKKNLGSLPATIQKYAKDLGYKETIAKDPKKLARLNEMARELVSQGKDPAEVLNEIFPEFLGEGKKAKAKEGGEFSQSELPSTFMDLRDKERAGRAAKALIPTGIGLAEQALTGGLLPLAQQKSAPITIEELLANKTPFKREKYFNTPSEMVAEKLMAGMTPEQQQQFIQDMNVQGLTLGAAGLAAGARPRGPKAISPSEILLPEKPVSPKALTYGASEEALGGVKPSAPVQEKPGLQGRVSKEVAESPTDMRVSRTEPETRIYNRLDNVKLREQQVKLFPQYESEIAADASARAAREEARRPKTPMGEANQAARMAEAEKTLPAVRKAYENSIGRVRALEDEIAKLSGTQRETAETLLQLAQRDLENAEFELIQTLNNARTGERRVGIPQMEKAAQEKMMKIADQIANGEEIKLAKMDYSPDLIAEANRISKSKKLPARRTDDFYTRVHDTYANQYKSRLAQIETEIQNSMKDKSLSSLFQRQQLAKEKDALNKMIKSAEAENAIHRHKIGLREISNRHRAHERFARLKKAEAGDKTAQVAREKMWRDRIEEAKTPEARAQVIEEGIEQAAAESPKHAEQIRKEGNKIGEAFEKLRQETENLNTEKIRNAPNAKEAAKRSKNIFGKLIDDYKELKDKFPNVWGTKLGKDLILGIGGAIWDTMRKEADIPVTSGSAAAVLGGGFRGSGRRFFINQITKWAIKEWQTANARKAYESDDEEKFSKYSAGIRKKARERSLGL